MKNFTKQKKIKHPNNKSIRKDLLDSMNDDPDHSNEIFREISAEEWRTVELFLKTAIKSLMS